MHCQHSEIPSICVGIDTVAHPLKLVKGAVFSCSSEKKKRHSYKRKKIFIQAMCFTLQLSFNQPWEVLKIVFTKSKMHGYKKKKKHEMRKTVQVNMNRLYITFTYFNFYHALRLSFTTICLRFPCARSSQMKIRICSVVLKYKKKKKNLPLFWIRTTFFFFFHLVKVTAFCGRLMPASFHKVYLELKFSVALRHKVRR